MRSDLPKVLHPLGGRPLLSHLLETVRSLRPSRVMSVVGHRSGDVKKAVGKGVIFVLQRRQRGTADAVLAAGRQIAKLKGPLFILSGDIPLLTREVLDRMRATFERENADLVLLTGRLDDPIGYGRIVRNGDGGISRIVEEQDAVDGEKKINEVNAGIYLARPEILLEPLKRIQKSSVSGEYYLTDLVGLLLEEGKSVATVEASDEDGWQGINSAAELAEAERRLRQRVNRDWIGRGVILKNPNHIMISPETVLERGAVIHTGVVFEGKCRVGRGTTILPYSVIEESRIGRNCKIGPFAHLRPGSVVGDGAHIGNFVELKKTVMKKGAKANHLTYLGDAVVGEGTNVGCGTITCNYDGFAKRKTVLGKKVFVGSDVQFVAPVRVGAGAWIAAGTTVTRNVPPGALALSRSEQKNIRGWVRKRARNRKRALTGSDSLRPGKRSLR